MADLPQALAQFNPGKAHMATLEELTTECYSRN